MRAGVDARQRQFDAITLGIGKKVTHSGCTGIVDINHLFKINNDRVRQRTLRTRLYQQRFACLLECLCIGKDQRPTEAEYDNAGNRSGF